MREHWTSSEISLLSEAYCEGEPQIGVLNQFNDFG